jgi:hypothetical protein
MKPEEIAFLKEIYQAHFEGDLIVREIVGKIYDNGKGTHYKRLWYYLEKWCDKGWYSYGVSLDLGWLTDTGLRKAQELNIVSKQHYI